MSLFHIYTLWGTLRTKIHCCILKIANEPHDFFCISPVYSAYKRQNQWHPAWGIELFLFLYFFYTAADFWLYSGNCGVLHQYIFTLRIFRSSAFCCANPGCLISSKIVFISYSSLSPASPVYLCVPFPLPRVWVEIFRNYFLLRGADPSEHLHLSLHVIVGKLGLERLKGFLSWEGQRVKERGGVPMGSTLCREPRPTDLYRLSLESVCFLF